MESNNKFKVLKWLRQVRDKNYITYGKYNISDFAMILSNNAKRSDFYKKLKINKK